jgi:hypothetical protein
MRRFLILAGLLGAIGTSLIAGNGVSLAQFNTFVQGPKAAGSSFVGVLDKESTITHCWAIVACGSAKAAAGVAAIDISNSTATVVCTGIKVLNNGMLDVSTGTTYCTGSITVTAVCTGGLCVSGGSYRITKIYDQVGSANQTSASFAVSPDFILSGVSSEPTWGCVSSRSSKLTATITSIVGAQAFGATYERNGSFSSYSAVLSDNGSSFGLGNPSTANTIWAQVFATTGNITGTATDGSGTTDFSHFHRALLTSPSAAGTADLYIDGNAPATGAASNDNATGTTMGICGYTGDFANAFMTNAWTDNTQPNSTVGEAVTNLTTVPLP